MTTGAETFSVKVTNQNTASDSADVANQFAAQFNQSVLHDTKIYSYSLDDPPEMKHKVALDLLEGGNPRDAERLLRSLVVGGRLTTERAYYYILSILGERSFIEINAPLTEEIHGIRKRCATLPADQWTEAVEVVHTLLSNAHATFEGDFAERNLEGYHALGSDRQTEIDRHLDLILSGATQEHLARQRKLSVATERMAFGRRERAWKFFEANPQRPKKYETLPPRLGMRDLWLAVLGAAITVWGLASMIADGVSAVTGCAIALMAAGIYLMLRCTTKRETYFLYAATTGSAFTAEVFDVEEPTTKLDNLVDQRFRKLGQLNDWSAGYRVHLKRRLRAQYAEADMYHGEVTWLVDWHAKRIDREQQDGERYDRVPMPPGMRSAFALRLVGAAVAVFGLYLALDEGHVEALLLVAASWGVVGTARLIARPRVRALAGKRADDLLADELAAYERWVEELADRPTDAEMARWMALDKLYLKDEALRRADLNERDLVTHVVLAERAPFARRGRVTNGPPRYEAYQVQLFLLTRYGMRSARTYLDFTSGDLKNEKRQMFPYDAVASASIEEADGPGNRLFELTLMSGVKIAEVRENVRNAADVATDGFDAVDGLVTRTSGFDSALRVLEAVATEGRDWIVRDEERKERWARNWSS